MAGNDKYKRFRLILLLRNRLGLSNENMQKFLDVIDEYRKFVINAIETQDRIISLSKGAVISVMVHKGIIVLYYGRQNAVLDKTYILFDQCGCPYLAKEYEVRNLLINQAHSNCVICAMIFGVKPQWIKSNSYTPPLVSSRNFVVRLDDHPIAEGHLLINTKSHVMSMANLSLEQIGELEKIKQMIKQIFRNLYDKETLFFEHGATGVCDAQIKTCGPNLQSPINHAHLHAIPMSSELDMISTIEEVKKRRLILNAIYFRKADNFIDAVKRNKLKEEKYIYIEGPGKSVDVAYNLPIGTSQIVRIIAAYALGYENLGDWRAGLNSDEGSRIYREWLVSAENNLLPMFSRAIRNE